MTQDKTGGPAFPLQSIGPDFAPGYAGMTLRDWFAGQALAGWLASFSADEAVEADGCAQLAYQLADAMIAARNGGQDTCL